MNRNELAWVVVRALGVIALWFLVLSILGLLLNVPFLVSTFFNSPVDPLRGFERKLNIFDTVSRSAIEIIVYGFFTRYLLRKGEFVHRLICDRIPEA